MVPPQMAAGMMAAGMPILALATSVAVGYQTYEAARSEAASVWSGVAEGATGAGRHADEEEGGGE
jgi:hypothetical protein